MRACSACGERNPAKAKFCLECGAALLAVETRGEERKVVTVLFADMVGFTSRSEALDVEDVRATLGPYHELLRRELERHGGVVEKFIGDAVMALFGAPVAQEDDPERAVRAGLGIHEAIAGLRADDPALDLHVRIGINTGEALVVLDADPAGAQGMAFGDVVNTAARLQSAAPVDGILVGEVTYRATHQVVAYRQMPDVHAKGKQAPVRVWAVEAARSRFAPDPEQAPTTRLVGRERELRTLRDAFERAADERAPHLVTLVGVPGIGKSRLVLELAGVIADRGASVTWLEGRSLPYGEPVAFWSLGEIVKAEAGILHSDPPAVAGEKLRIAVESLIPAKGDASRIERHLRNLLGLERPGDELGRDQLAAAFAAWRGFIEALAARRTTVLVFDDVHWADDGLLDFIEHVMDWVEDVPLMLLCTARPDLLERRAAWRGRAANSTTFAVPPLSADDTARLVSVLLDQAVLPPDTQRALLERSGGNALYAHEYVRMLIDRGLLVRGTRGWEPASGAPLPHPETIQALILARLDALPKDEKRALQQAAVIGKVVWTGAVAHLLDVDSARTDGLLQRAAAKQLLRREPQSQIDGETQYAFQHALIRDVAYGGLTRPARARAHEAVAGWIESLASGRDDQPQLVAHHLLEAVRLNDASGVTDPQLRARAASVAGAAGEHALSVNAFSTAGEYFDRALELLEPAHPDHWNTRIGRGRAALYQSDVLDPDFERAVLGPPAEASRTRAAFLLAEVSVWRTNHGDTDHAFELGEAALRLAAGEPPSAQKAFIVGSLGGMYIIGHRDLDRGLVLCTESRDIAELVGATDIVAADMMSLGIARYMRGDSDGAVRDLRQSVEIARRTTSVWAVVAFLNTANVLADLGDLDAARDLLEEGMSAARAVGSRTFQPSLRESLADVAFQQGRWHEVAALAEPDVGLTLHRLDVIAGREDVALHRLETLSPYLEDSLEQRLEARALKAYCLARCGQSAEAAATLREALDLGRDWPGWSSSSAVEVALAALLAGGPSAAESALAHDRLATPWSACALDLLRANRSGALATVRGLGSVPYEAAILDYVGRCPDVPADERAAALTRRDELLRDLPAAAAAAVGCGREAEPSRGDGGSVRR
jgi:class 3 adenylate cyclase/tetratricopeptide (TPR) repeat protein